MTTLHRTPTGLVSYVKGSPQQLLDRRSHVTWDGIEIALDDDLRHQVTVADDELAGETLRVLAVVYRHLDASDFDADYPNQVGAEHDLTLICLVAMMDPTPPRGHRAVAACRRAGIRIIMDTGDYGVTAEAIARQVGIVTSPYPGNISGQQLEAMTELQLIDELRAHPEMVFSRVRPKHKLRVVAAVQ